MMDIEIQSKAHCVRFVSNSAGLSLKNHLAFDLADALYCPDTCSAMHCYHDDGTVRINLDLADLGVFFLTFEQARWLSERLFDALRQSGFCITEEQAPADELV